MSADINELIKKYQAGEEVRAEIVASIEKKEIIQKMLNDNQYLMEYHYDEKDTYNQSLDYALKNYRFDRGAEFTTYLYMLYRGRLINEYEKEKREKADGAIIRNMAAFSEAVKDILGSPVDHEIIKENTRLFDDEIMSRLSEKQKDYIALYLTFATKNIKLTDEIAGQVLGKTRRTVINYRDKLRELLLEKGEYKELLQERARRAAADDEDLNIYNEYGAKDPTPREAVRRIKYGPGIDENEHNIVPENIKNVGGTVGHVLSFRDDDQAWGNGCCLKCNHSLTTAGKCSNTNNCSG